MFSLQKVLKEVSKFKIKSITDSLFRYGFCFAVLGVIAAAIPSVASWVVIIVLCFAGLLILLGASVFVAFCVINPDYLRSEEFQLEREAQSLLGDKRHHFETSVDSLPSTTNPLIKDGGSDSKEIKL